VEGRDGGMSMSNEYTTVRDYNADMASLITEGTATPYSVPRVAADIVKRLENDDPDLLRGWLWENRYTFVHNYIGDRARSTRSHARMTAKRRAFRDAAESGDAAALSGFLHAEYQVADGTYRPLADLTADDLLFVEQGYADEIASRKFEKAFIAALRKRVGTETVGDVFTEEQITAIRRNLGGAAA
jgi:hypothetical protein